MCVVSFSARVQHGGARPAADVLRHGDVHEDHAPLHRGRLPPGVQTPALAAAAARPTAAGDLSAGTLS